MKNLILKNTPTPTTAISTATAVDILSGLLLEQERQELQAVELSTAIKSSLIKVDYSDAQAVEDATAAACALIPIAEQNEPVTAEQIVGDFIALEIGAMKTTALLRAATRLCLHEIAGEINKLGEPEGKRISKKIRDAQDSITKKLTATSALPAWVWMDENDVKSLKIGYTQEKGATASERKEKNLQLDFLSHLKDEQRIFNVLANCLETSTMRRDVGWIEACNASILQANQIKTENVKILEQIKALNPAIESESFEQYKIMTRNGLPTTQKDLEFVETLLIASGKNGDVIKEKEKLRVAVAEFHAEQSKAGAVKQAEHEQAEEVLERLGNMNLLDVLKDYEDLKPKYGALVTANDELAITIALQDELIAELKAQLNAATMPVKKTGTKG